MRLYVCPECDSTLAAGSDGLELHGAAHGSEKDQHTGQKLVEVPEIAYSPEFAELLRESKTFATVKGKERLAELRALERARDPKDPAPELALAEEGAAVLEDAKDAPEDAKVAPLAEKAGADAAVHRKASKHPRYPSR